MRSEQGQELPALCKADLGAPCIKPSYNPMNTQAREAQLAKTRDVQSRQAQDAQARPESKRWIDPAVIDSYVQYAPACLERVQIFASWSAPQRQHLHSLLMSPPKGIKLCKQLWFAQNGQARDIAHRPA